MKHALDPDSHPGEFEIHYIVNGELNWWVEDTAYPLRAGHVLIVRPNELHGSNTGVLEPCEHYWLRVTFPKSNALPGLSITQTRSLCKAVTNIRQRAFAGSPAVRDAFARIIDEHRHRTEHSAIASRAVLHTLLVTITRDHGHAIQQPHETPAQISPGIQKGIRAIHRNLSQPPSIGQLAEHAGLSESAFRKQFKRDVGCSPLDYLNRRRVQEAKRQLTRRKASVKEIAYNLGFSSVQYFSTVFKRVTGVSPGSYQP